MSAMAAILKIYFSAYLQWLCHSGERPVAHGPLVLKAPYSSKIDILLSKKGLLIYGINTTIKCDT